MQKMLVAASSAEHRTLLYEIFASQYELLQTDNSRELCELLQQHKDELTLALISATLAERITKEDAAGDAADTWSHTFNRFICQNCPFRSVM